MQRTPAHSGYPPTSCDSPPHDRGSPLTDTAPERPSSVPNHLNPDDHPCHEQSTAPTSPRHPRGDATVHRLRAAGPPSDPPPHRPVTPHSPACDHPQGERIAHLRETRAHHGFSASGCPTRRGGYREGRSGCKTHSFASIQRLFDVYPCFTALPCGTNQSAVESMSLYVTRRVFRIRTPGNGGHTVTRGGGCLAVPRRASRHCTAHPEYLITTPHTAPRANRYYLGISVYGVSGRFGQCRRKAEIQATVKTVMERIRTRRNGDTRGGGEWVYGGRKGYTLSVKRLYEGRFSALGRAEKGIK